MEIIINIEKAKSRFDTLLINNKYIHSKYNPEKEADNIVFENKNIISIFGAGLCYHINNIIKNNSESIFIVYEPVEEIFNLIDRYLTKDIDRSKILVLNKIDFGHIYTFIENNNILATARIKYYSNPGYKNLFPNLELKFFETIKNCYELFTQNILTESHFYSLWSKNFIKNFFLLSEKPILNIKKMDLLDNIAVIVCAGPTLFNDIEYLKEFRDKITIFCVDTAFKTLFKNNVKPDFVISLDGQHHSIYDFFDLDNTTIVLFDITAYPYLCREYKNSYFTTTENLLKSGIIEYFFKKFSLNIQGISVGGTVADYAFKLAINLGFRNILFCGLDLSYPDLITHCKESPYYEKIMLESSYFNNPETIMIKNISQRNIKIARSKLGRNIISDFVLLNYKENFNLFAEYKKDIKIFNSLNNGILIENFKDVDIFDFLKKSDSFRIEGNDIILRLDRIKIQKEEIMNFYRDLEKELYDNSLIIKEILENTDFSQNNLDILNKIKFKIQNILKNYPFLNKFITMTNIILNKKNITENNLIYYKHISHALLQSIYFLIRNIQKNTQKFIEK
ncbi:MAG TPA: DUF115 domain-containing protein [Spirochaetota bacterium]|nr:DUF115 domain-containing protein [Spirochaetota bacterium]